MNHIDRRHFLSTAGAACLSMAASRSGASVVKKEKIKIGQIGTGHAHASGVFSQLRQVTDDYELVGIVENDPERRKSLGDSFQGFVNGHLAVGLVSAEVIPLRSAQV